jgi:tetratricopeptide (TPR) repeat protein
MIERNGAVALQELEPFEERIEILARELELAIKWQRPCVLLAVCGSDYLRSDAEAALEDYLIDLGQKAAPVRVGGGSTDDVVQFLREFTDPVHTVFFVEGLHWDPDRQAGAYASLNLQREYFAERRVRVIFWLTQNEIMSLAHRAPDFWECRHRVIEFIESPKGGQVLTGALESAWQATGGHADPLEAADAGISRGESSMIQLPQGDEPGYARANLQLTLGILNWRKGEYEKADELLQGALRLAVKIRDNWFEAECFNAMALVKTGLGRIDEAIDSYKRAIQLAPEQIFAWNNLGNLCSKIGRNDEAIVAFQKAIECNPKDPIGWNGLGNVYCRIGYMDDAIAAFRRSIQFMPTFAHPWNGLGDVYAHTGRTDEAVKCYHKAIELNEQYSTPWLRLAALFAKQDRAQEAIRAYRRALELDPGNSTTWNALGTIHLQRNAFEAAADAFSKAIELDRDFGWAYSNLALAHVQQGKYGQTISLYLKSIELLNDDRDKAVCWNRLADVYRLLNDYDNAIAAYQTADSLGAATPAPKAQRPVNGPESPASLDEAEGRTQALNDVPDVLVEKPVAEHRNGAAGRTGDYRPADAPDWIFNPVPSSQIEMASAPNGGRPPKPGERPLILRPGNDAPEAKGVVMKPTFPTMPPAQNPTAAQVVPTEKSEEARPGGSSAQAWNEKGNVHFKARAFDQAIDAYNKAIQLEPSFGRPYSNLALTYLAQGQYPEAILLFQKSIELLSSDKDKAVSWNGLGNVYRCSNDYANAVAAYQKAAQLDPETAGMRDGADSFQVGQNPKSAQVWNDLGELFLRTGAYDEANNAFNKAVELEPESGWPYNNLANVLVSEGQYEKAIPLYQKSIGLLQENKDKAAVWNRLGNAYRKLNDYDNAIKAYQEAVLLADEGVSLLTRTRFSLLSNCYTDQ